MKDALQAEEKQFAEEVGIVFEQTGMPRMAGRILGWLLISDPPHQSMEQLTKALIASKGSISSMTRLLIQLGLIERLSLPGVRHDYFRLRSDAWQHMIGRGLTGEIRMVRQLAEQGEPWTLVVDSSTRSLLAEYLTTRSVGAVEVKGLDYPVFAYVAELVGGSKR